MAIENFALFANSNSANQKIIWRSYFFADFLFIPIGMIIQMISEFFEKTRFLTTPTEAHPFYEYYKQVVHMHISACNVWPLSTVNFFSGSAGMKINLHSKPIQQNIR